MFLVENYILNIPEKYRHDKFIRDCQNETVFDKARKRELWTSKYWNTNYK